jgi:hypothetical protein
MTPERFAPASLFAENLAELQPPRVEPKIRATATRVNLLYACFIIMAPSVSAVGTETSPAVNIPALGMRG